MATGSFPPNSPSEEIWHPTVLAGSLDGIEGYALRAADGAIGTITAANSELGRSYLIATGGSWNQGRTVMLPPGVVERIDRDERVVHVRCTREQVRAAPPFENDRYQDRAYRVELGAHYATASSPVPSAAAPRSIPATAPDSTAAAHRFGLLEHWFDRVGAG